MTPLLTVLIDTYNHERYIEQAVVSAIEQDFPVSDYEILVVDDDSTDRTPEIVRKFAPRVRLLRKKNGGQASAFNAGIPETRGEIVAFLDGDDWFARGKLSAVMAALEQHPEASAVGHGRYEFHEESRQAGEYRPLRPRFVNLATPGAAREALEVWHFLLPSSLTVRKKMLERILPLPEALTFCADSIIQVAAMASGTFVLEELLCYYRRHQSNLYEVGPEDPARMRRRLDMHELSLELGLRVLLGLGVCPECARELIWPVWIRDSRLNLSTFGGNRLKAFRTEMRYFHLTYRNPTIGYRVFKYAVVGAATLLLPPAQFYKMREWCGQRNLGRFVSRVFKQA